MSPVVRNVLSYVAIAIGAALLATGLQLGVVLSGTDPILWRPLAATFVSTLFAALSTAAGAAFRPKAGREDISALVSEVGTENAKAALEGEADRQAGVVDSPLTVAAVADELERRVAEREKQPRG